MVYLAYQNAAAEEVQRHLRIVQVCEVVLQPENFFHSLSDRNVKEILGPNSPWANSKIPTFHFFPMGGRFDFINWFILPRITGNRLLGGEKGLECCALDESLKHLSLPWQHKLSSRRNAFFWPYSRLVL